MLNENQKQTLKDIFNSHSVPGYLKEDVKENFPELNSLRNGVWYKYRDSEIHLVQFTEAEDGRGFGIDAGGWSGKTGKWSINYLEIAPPSYVLEKLKEVAKEKGLLDCDAYIDTAGEEQTLDKNTPFRPIGFRLWRGSESVILQEGKGLIYDDGKWATVMESGLLL